MADVERETEATHLIPKRGSRRSRDEPGRYGLSGSVHEDPELPESSRAPNLERKWSIEPVQPITLSWTGIQVHVHPQTGCLDRVRRRPPAEPKHILKNGEGNNWVCAPYYMYDLEHILMPVRFNGMPIGYVIAI